APGAAFGAALAVPRHPAAWSRVWAERRGALLASSPANAYQHDAIGAALAALADGAAAGGFKGVVDLSGMCALLERELERPSSPRGFLTGAVTVCELVPMRTIPFRVVCLLGLNDGGFPRARRPLGFDVMAAQPQPG